MEMKEEVLAVALAAEGPTWVEDSDKVVVSVRQEVEDSAPLQGAVVLEPLQGVALDVIPAVWAEVN